LADGISNAKNLLLSEDVLATIKVLKKLGIKSRIKNNSCKIYGKGINGFEYKKNITLNAENSGTLGRLILGLLINTPYRIKLTGDKSLSKRDFRRISDPLSKFGATFQLNKNKGLPLTILGSKELKPIHYYEKRGSAQCKSAVIFGALKTEGKTFIKCKPSREPH
jgi:3-phosphoshikimate 1-carboxyvinyltransferase